MYVARHDRKDDQRDDGRGDDAVADPPVAQYRHSREQGLEQRGISMVSGQITEVVISHCFQADGFFCAGEGGVNQNSMPGSM